MYPPPDSTLPAQVPPRRWHPLLAVPAVVVATLVVPPLGAALAFMARWDKAGRAVTVVLASIWFAVLVLAGRGPQPVHDDAGPRPVPAATVTVTAPPPAPAAAGAGVPVPGTVSPSAAAASTGSVPPVPAPASTPGRTPAPPAPADRPGEARPPAADDAKARNPVRAPAGGGPSSGSNSSTGSASSGNGSVSYRNCTAVRAAHAAPIRRGDPGFGPHLDRDGDGIACE
ncbi:excalibur calcium-binding domain-containing protein [Streptomyces virginiae]|uniref:excalibur calcium-binding domain-containing protein n=2 Tax=Streptomyces virginiae TaxID=1961 RepID=UPI002E28A947|nr:excalibur calcium-binding domain-containing protein [Streptomyces virginiae]